MKIEWKRDETNTTLEEATIAGYILSVQPEAQGYSGKIYTHDTDDSIECLFKTRDEAKQWAEKEIIVVITYELSITEERVVELKEILK